MAPTYPQILPHQPEEQGHHDDCPRNGWAGCQIADEQHGPDASSDHGQGKGQDSGPHHRWDPAGEETHGVHTPLVTATSWHRLKTDVYT